MKKFLSILVLVLACYVNARSQDEYRLYDTTETQFMESYNLFMDRVSQIDSLRGILEDELDLLKGSHSIEGEHANKRDFILWNFVGNHGLYFAAILEVAMHGPNKTSTEYFLPPCTECRTKQLEVDEHKKRIYSEAYAIREKAAELGPEIDRFLLH
jgi:hypothetical protein